MKILHSIYDYPENSWLGGGGAFRTFEICRRLSERHEVTLLCGNYPGAPRESEQENLRVIHVGSAGSYALSRLSYAYHASRFVSDARPDLWTYSFSAFAPLLASERSRDNAILECFHVMQSHATEKHAILGHVAAAAESATLEAYDRIISISPSASRQIADLRRRSDGIRVVYTGVDATCFIDDPVEEDYILYFGRLDTYTKGLDLLIDAFSRITEANPGVRLVIAGRGTPGRVAELEEMISAKGISHRATLTGPVETETKTDLFRKSLFNVAPSRYEGWCIAAVEASAASKAVVGTRIPGLKDAVKDGQTGLLAESEDVDGIASRMQQLIEDDTLRKTLGQQGRLWADQFTWDSVASSQEGVYLEVLDGRTNNKGGAE